MRVSYAVLHDTQITMAHAGMRQVHQQLSRARGGRLYGLDLGADMARLVIDDSAVVRRDFFDGGH